jgi:hypothetical protein
MLEFARPRHLYLNKTRRRWRIERLGLLASGVACWPHTDAALRKHRHLASTEALEQ